MDLSTSLTPADLRAAAARHGIQLGDGDFALDTSGLDFVAAHVPDVHGVRWILRVPRRPDVIARAAIEARVLALVAARLPAAVPAWRVHTPELIAYHRLADEPAWTMDPAAGAVTWHIDHAPPRAAFVDALARLLVALQGVPADAAAAAGVPCLAARDLRDAMAARIAAARQVIEIPEVIWQRWQTWLATSALWPTHAAFGHGDLHPGHLLVDGAQRITGVLDWTEGKVADPAIDFALILQCFGREVLGDVMARFAAAGGRTWSSLAEHTAALQSTFPVAMVEFAQLSGQPALLDMARGMLVVAADAAGTAA